MTDYGYSVEVAEGYDEAVIRTRLAMRGEGFSILTEAHVGELFGAQAGDDRQYLFMGVWSPSISDARIDRELQVAVHLPCNVVVQEMGAGAIIAAQDPVDELATEDSATVRAAEAARDALGRVFQRVGAPT